MNEANYASLEASKRLAEEGIVLKTEAWWKIDQYGAYLSDMPPAPGRPTTEVIPSPCMAEVWRELPPQGCYLTANQGYYHAWIVWTGFEGYEKSYDAKEYTNPTDALISLLIWVRKENNAS